MHGNQQSYGAHEAASKLMNIEFANLFITFWISKIFFFKTSIFYYTQCKMKRAQNSFQNIFYIYYTDRVHRHFDTTTLIAGGNTTNATTSAAAFKWN